MSTRHENKARTRAALAEAAERLILAQGYEPVTARQIAEAAGVSRRTFFRYFEGKEAAFLHRQEELRRGFYRWFEGEATPETAHARLRRGLLQLCEAYAAEAPLHLARQRVIAAHPALVAADLAVDHRWEADFAVMLSHGTAPFTASVQACALMGAIRATLRAWYASGCAQDLTGLALRALDALERGLPMGAPAPLTAQELR
ncbi:MAG: TetR family transcriptional regulator [Alphaproteobacteria bacterium]|nr:TetR family transcriptional regulator [Alphaproteobacteria bacterium]